MANERISLIKIQPKRIIPNRYTSLVSGLDYTTDFCPAEPDEVYQGQTPITFSYDRKTKVLSFTANSPVNDDIFIEYTLRFSTGQATYRRANDSNTYNANLYTSNDREYLPRLRSHPRTIYKANDSFTGVVSVDTTGIVLVNDDLALNKYITKFDMYLERPFSSYLAYGLEDTAPIEKLGSGVIASIKFGRSVSLSVKNEIYKLNTPATMGNADEHVNFSEANYPSGDPDHWDKKIPFVTSIRSGYYSSSLDISNGIRVSNASGFQSGYRYNSLANNDYILCVAHDPEPLTGTQINISFVSSFVKDGLNLVHYTVSGGSFISGAQIGVYDSNSATNKRAFVYSAPNNGSIYFYAGAPGVGETYTKILMPPIYVRFSDRAGPVYEGGSINAMYGNGVFPGSNDYYLTYTNTAQGDKLIKMIANSSQVEGVDFDLDWYIHTAQGSLSYKEVENRIANDLGFTPNPFTGGNPVKDVIHIDGETDTYFNVVSRIAQTLYSTATINRINQLSFSAIELHDEAEIQTLISSTASITPSQILGDVKAILDYNDIYTKVTFKQRITKSSHTNSSDLLLDLGVKDKEYVFADSVSLFATIDEVARALEVLSYPVVLYQFNIETKTWYDLFAVRPDVGTYILLDEMGGRLMGGDDQALLRIIGFELAADKIKVIAYDVQKIS